VLGADHVDLAGSRRSSPPGDALVTRRKGDAPLPVQVVDLLLERCVRAGRGARAPRRGSAWRRRCVVMAYGVCKDRPLRGDEERRTRRRTGVRPVRRRRGARHRLGAVRRRAMRELRRRRRQCQAYGVCKDRPLRDDEERRTRRRTGVRPLRRDGSAARRRGVRQCRPVVVVVVFVGAEVVVERPFRVLERSTLLAQRVDVVVSERQRQRRHVAKVARRGLFSGAVIARTRLARDRPDAVRVGGVTTGVVGRVRRRRRNPAQGGRGPDESHHWQLPLRDPRIIHRRFFTSLFTKLLTILFRLIAIFCRWPGRERHGPHVEDLRRIQTL
jgi:hypothetical protein